MNLSKLWEIGKDREVWRAAVHGVTKSWLWFSEWKTTKRGSYNNVIVREERAIRWLKIWPKIRDEKVSVGSHHCWIGCCLSYAKRKDLDLVLVVGSPYLFEFSTVAVIHTVKSFSIVNEEELDVFLEFPSFPYDPTNVSNLISSSSAFSKSTLSIWSSCLKDIEQHLTSIVKWAQLYSSLNILWHCPSLGLEWKLTSSRPVSTAESSKLAGLLSAALSQHLLGCEIAHLEFHHLH